MKTWPETDGVRCSQCHTRTAADSLIGGRLCGRCYEAYEVAGWLCDLHGITVSVFTSRCRVCPAQPSVCVFCQTALDAPVTVGAYSPGRTVHHGRRPEAPAHRTCQTEHLRLTAMDRAADRYAEAAV